MGLEDVADVPAAKHIAIRLTQLGDIIDRLVDGLPGVPIQIDYWQVADASFSGADAGMASSEKTILPLSGVRMPAIMCKRVVLPDPLDPINPSCSPVIHEQFLDIDDGNDAAVGPDVSFDQLRNCQCHNDSAPPMDRRQSSAKARRNRKTSGGQGDASRVEAAAIMRRKTCERFPAARGWRQRNGAEQAGLSCRTESHRKSCGDARTPAAGAQRSPRSGGPEAGRSRIPCARASPAAGDRGNPARCA